MLKPWDGTSRLNLLLLGIDRRPGETGLGYRTDTMMLVSLDPKTHSVGLLSIPRDLYVQLPGYSAPQRINTALALGELQRAGYGPTLAMQTVQYNLGMPINDYVIADFNALIKLVDSIGGIDVDVPAPIADYDFPDMGYGYDPLILSAGLQHMDGYTAQKYARTRHGDSDFDRARRQQQVLVRHPRPRAEPRRAAAVDPASAEPVRLGQPERQHRADARPDDLAGAVAQRPARRATSTPA